MGNRLDNLKKDNIDKIRTGSCIELFLLTKYINYDFDKLNDFIIENECLLNNQNKSTILQQIEDTKNVLINNLDIIMDDIDKERFLS